MTLDEAKKHIDTLSQLEMCRLHRFAPTGHPYFQHGAIYDYFSNRLKELGGFTPEISKQLGWDN